MVLENIIKSHENVIESLRNEMMAFEPTTSASLENCLEEKDNEKYSDDSDDCVEQLTLNISNEETVFSCELCDYKSCMEEDIKPHKVEMHQVKCEFCEELFIGTSKLEKHMCIQKIGV